MFGFISTLVPHGECAIRHKHHAEPYTVYLQGVWLLEGRLLVLGGTIERQGYFALLAFGNIH